MTTNNKTLSKSFYIFSVRLFLLSLFGVKEQVLAVLIGDYDFGEGVNKQNEDLLT